MFPSVGLNPPVIPSNKVRVLPNADLQQFALLTSAMHMAWVRYIGGRLKSDFQYGIGVIYNTFPPPPGDADLSKLEALAQAILDARTARTAKRRWPTSTIRTSCRRISAARIKPSTAPWIASTAEAASPRNASAWSISSPCTRKCARRLRRG